MSEKFQFQFELGREPGKKREQAPMRLLMLGDFSGQSAIGRTPLPDRKPVRIDIDQLWKVANAMAPRCMTTAGDIELRDLEDLHPDRLFDRLKLFSALKEKRSQPAPTGEGSPLAALLGGAPTPAAPAPEASDKSGIEALLHQAIAPHIVPDTRAQDRAWQQAIDAAISDQMRQLLHDPAFQSLEANWRGVDWLVSNLDCDGLLQLFLFDVSREELTEDLGGAGSIKDSSLLAALRAEGQWSALLSLETFGPQDADISLLAGLGAIGSLLGGPCIANAARTLWNPSEGADLDAWQLLRESEVAPWIGLVAPRLLMRQPYGKRSDPLDRFEFEELDGEPAHEHFLWAPGSLGIALLLGRSYEQADGWNFVLGTERDLEDLPMVTRIDRHGDPELLPCAEVFLSDAESESLMDRGLMNWISHRHQNAVLLHRFGSISASHDALMALQN